MSAAVRRGGIRVRVRVERRIAHVRPSCHALGGRGMLGVQIMDNHTPPGAAAHQAGSGRADSFLRVGLVGFGRTGKAVASVLLEAKDTRLEWVVRRSRRLEHRSVPEFLGIDSEEPGLIYSTEDTPCHELLDAHPVDAIVDFSGEDGLEYYADEARARGAAVVSAISNYSDERIAYLHQLAQATRVIYSPNITLGINFLILASKVLQRMAPFADIVVLEEHFRAKADVSGTARVIARNLGLDPADIKMVRAGGIVGVHEVLFGFPYQTVRLKHESITREAFGNGALFVLRHLPEARTGFYTVQDLMRPYFQLDLPPDAAKPDWLTIA